jgi:hypothetical protein
MAAMRTRWNAASSLTVWAAATLAGIAVCWLGVRPVLAAVVPDRLVAFPANAPAPQVTMLPGESPSPKASGSSAAPRSPSRSSPSATPSASAPAVPVIVDGWTLFGDGQYTRSFQLSGGTATVLATRGKLELLSATPRPGFVMTVMPTAEDRVVVNFTGGLLRVSTLDARWRDDAPTATVTELP